MNDVTQTYPLHPQLLADCHRLGCLSATHLLFHRNATVLWFILVPEADLANFLDLPAAQREAVLADCKRISDSLGETLSDPKVNVAWIGNLVLALHIHVIGRRPGDSCWPKPVWGHLETVRAYSAHEIGTIRDALETAGLSF
ncbi:HIT family protein [Thiocystis minor]|uniref:HIT family protein n=1 Tax=Thiocystis minor TaxID=61597 RepID=UPI0030B8FEC0